MLPHPSPSRLLLPLLLAAGPAWAQDPDAGTAEEAPRDGAFIVGLNGGGWVQAGGARPVPLDRCVAVPVGATICTDETSFVTVRLAPTPDVADAEDVVLLPGTCVAVESVGAERVRLAIQSGGISVSAEEPDPAGAGGGGTGGGADGDGAPSLEVRTRDGVTSGTSGGFRVQLEEEATRAEAVGGRVTLENEAGAVELGVGEGGRLRAGERPEEPVDLLLTEALLAPGDGEVLRRPDFRWEPVPYASSYRVELSSDAAFTDLVESSDVADAGWSPALLFAPTQVDGLWWRVAAYDRFGFLGVPSAPRRLRLPGTAAPAPQPAPPSPPAEEDAP